MLGKSVWFVSALVALTIACGSDDSDSDQDGSGGTTAGGGGSWGGGEGGGEGGGTAANCMSRCESKATACGAPADVAASECASLCSLSPSEDQAQCMENTSCSALEAAFMDGQYPCGIGSSGGSMGGSSGIGGSGGSTVGKGLGQSCDCPDEGDWVKCSGTDAPCKPELMCIEFGDEKICTEPCTPGSCGAGLECTELNWGGTDMGDYCW